MLNNLVLLDQQDGIYTVYILSQKFDIVPDCTESDYYVEFFSEKDSFKIYIVKNLPDHSLILGMQSLDIMTRDSLLAKFSERVTKDIVEFIIKGDNHEKPFLLQNYLDEWYKYAMEVFTKHFLMSE